MESMEEAQAREGLLFVHPFENPDVIAGQGTVGLEIVEDLPEVELIVVPVGGGGLISGVATAVKPRSSKTRIVGVEPEGSTAVTQSLRAGRPVRLEQFGTVADGLNAPWGGPNTLGIVQRYVDEMVTVTDRQIVEAVGLILEQAKLLVEPAGAAGVAALLSERVPNAKGRRVVCILSGGNVDMSALGGFLG